MLQTPQQVAAWLHARVTGTLRTDSRRVLPGDAFIAWPGAVVDGRTFVAAALQAGAAAVLVEDDGAAAFINAVSGLDADPRVVRYRGLKAAAGLIAADYFALPSNQLAVLAVTGTNGKTSTAWWLAQALSALPAALALPCGLVGTMGVGRPPALAPVAAAAVTVTDEVGAPVAPSGGELVLTGLTTPDPVQLQQALRTFVDQGLRACAMEASSIGLAEQRMAGCAVRVAVFTNFTQDHLDYHGSMAAYWDAKRALFAWSGLHSAVINIDDMRGARLAQELARRADGVAPLELWTVAMDAPARLQALRVGYHAQGLHFDVVEQGADVDSPVTVQVPLLGVYNVMNVLGVLATLRALGVPLAEAAQVCSRLTPVPGRMECISAPQAPLVAVDYAHTPDALGAALRALRPMAQQRGGQLWCVFGCGGDRDASKRPLMGAVAVSLADQVVITSDNPRSEPPQSIIAQILRGAPDTAVQVDRALAIAQTIASAAASDVVLVAGKGHEQTQEMAGMKVPFSDRQQVEWALATRSEAALHAMMTVQQAAHWMANARLVGSGAQLVQRVHTDTRTIEPGDLFVALHGERFDANTLLHEAQQRGAAAVVCHVGLDAASYPEGLVRIEVADTRAALAQLATGWRRQFQLPLIAVTGSNGKTTVTQMLASILAAHAPDGAALATRGNFNNDIGVPLTVLRLRAQHRIAVLELGMNHPGEIAQLAAIAQPTVALVNNAQREHLEFMHTVQAVAAENGAVLRALPAHGVAVFPADDAYTPLWQTLAGECATHCFSDATQDDALHCVDAVWRNGAWAVTARMADLELHYTLHIAGRHNVRNSLAAARCALAAGVAVPALVQGLQAFRPVQGRSRAFAIATDTAGLQMCTVVDDTYNANPDSVRAAIAVLRELPAPRLLVLGDMGEVGQDGPALHAEAGRLAAAAGIEHVYCLGALMRDAVAAHGSARHFDSMDALNNAVLALLPSLASVLVKGSRFMRMERVLAVLPPALPDSARNGEHTCC